MTSEDATTRTLRHLREDVRLLAIAALEPERFTFDLHLMAMGLSSDDRPEAHLVVAILLRAAQGKEPRSWGPDAPPFLRRFSHAYNESPKRVDYEAAVGLLAAALDVHENQARRLLDAHRNDGKGLEGHAAMRR